MKAKQTDNTPLAKKTSRNVKPEVFDSILDMISSGKSLNKACKEHKISRASFMWMCDKYEGCRVKYARAREACLEVWADEIIDISDEAEDVADTPFTGGNAVQAKKARVDARKWILSKLLPKKYGDSSKLELTGKDGGAIETTTSQALTPEQFAVLKEQSERVADTMRRKIEES